MGWWSTDIMGGDTPYDIQGDFDHTFGDPIEDEDQCWATFSKPVSGVKMLEFIANTEKAYGAFSSPEVIGQVVGFIAIDNGWPMSQDFRKKVLASIDAEEVDGWTDNSERQQALDTFRTLVENYPSKGSKVEMPHQKGLFEQLDELFR